MGGCEGLLLADAQNAGLCLVAACSRWATGTGILGALIGLITTDPRLVGDGLCHHAPTNHVIVA